MRLTLRTLLAYLDGVLESADRDDLHEQIEASEFARDLIHRTRDVSRRLRLGAPEPLGEGPIDDPNTMAEYLDNTLPMESVPEFERHCLESDVILAEATASHHVLAMVLGRPAEIDSETRDRVHALPVTLREAERLRIESAHGQAMDSGVSSGPESVASRPVDTGGLPDYLRESDRSALLRWAPAIAALLLLCVTAYLTFFQRGEMVADTAPVSEQELVAEPEPSLVEETGTDLLSESSSEDALDEPPDPVATELAEPPAETNEIASQQEGEANQVPVAVPSGDVASTPELEEAEDAADLAAPDSETVQENLVVEENPDEPAEEPTAVEPVAEAYSDAGRFAGPEVCLLTVESTQDTWRRVMVDNPIAFGSRLMVLPTYRGEVVLANGLTATLVGSTEAVLPSPEKDPNEITLDLRFGRVVITNPTEEEIALRLLIGGEESVVELLPGSFVAVESDREYRAGFDVLNVSPPAVTWVYAPKGGLVWNDDGLRLKIDSGKQWELTPSGGLAAFSDYQGDPGWVESLRLTPWDEQASPLLSRAVAEDREVWPQLREVVDGDSFKEVRALAARCGAAVGHPDPLTASFSDEAQRPVWADNLAELRRLASRNTIEAERVRQSLVEQHGELLGEDLFRMIRGFGQEEVGQRRKEIEDDALARILDWLGSEALASRILANLNLEEMTGRKGVFNPTDTPTRRRQAIRRLRKWYNDNELRVASFSG